MKATALGNKICRRVCYLPPVSIYGLLWRARQKLCVNGHLRLAYAAKKGVKFVLENPISTLLWRYRPLRVLWQISCIKLLVPLALLPTKSPAKLPNRDTAEEAPRDTCDDLAGCIRGIHAQTRTWTAFFDSSWTL